MMFGISKRITGICSVALLMGLAASAVAAEKKQYDKLPEMKIDPAKTYVATIDTSLGTIKAELFPKIAPKTVNSFVFLAKEGFYEGVIFHRVIPGFMIQGGDPTGTGSGGPGYNVPAEFNEMKHERGVLSMARASDPDSAGSQFFIMHAKSPHLDGQYTAFGKVTQGLDVVDKIVNLPTDARDRPVEPPTIKSVKIEEKSDKKSDEKKDDAKSDEPKKEEAK